LKTKRKHDLVDDRAVLVQDAVELAQERVFRTDLAGRKEDGLHAAVHQRLDRRLERLVRGAVPELEEIEVAALGIEVEAVDAELAPAHLEGGLVLGDPVLALQVLLHRLFVGGHRA
jgi:hypothetical protein